MFNEMAYTWIYTYFHTPALHAALPIVYFLAAGILAAGGWRLSHGLGLVVVAGAVAAAALSAAGRAGVPRALAKIVEILRAMAATGIGLVKSRRGERFQTWELPASSRRAG